MSLPIAFIMLVSYLLTSFNVTAIEQADKKWATTTFSGGCFWCMQEPFDLLPGVIKTMPGYTGGNTKKSYLQRGFKRNHRACRSHADNLFAQHHQL